MINTIAFKTWENLLHTYVDDFGRVNYGRWKAESADVLREWLESWLVCAAVGCPMLRRGAYLPESVRTQLETDANRFIHNSDRVRVETEISNP